MNYSIQAISTNGCAVLLLIVLLLNYGRKRNRHMDESRMFLAMIVSNIFQCIVETITIVIDGKLFAGAISLATVLNALLFINNILFAYLWSRYALIKVRFEKKHRVCLGVLQVLPAAIIIAGAVVNLFSPVFFRITEENVYVRIGLYPLAYAVTYFYLLLGAVTVYRYRKRVEKFTFLPVINFLAPVFLASMVQYYLPGVSLVWAGSAIGLASVYMNLLDERASTDELSGLFSRHYLNQFLDSLSSRTRDSGYILGIMLDVDDFKQINDKFGHLVGDRAIVAVGDILRDAIPINGALFRYAGDEFVAIIDIDDLSEVQSILYRIQEKTDRFQEKHDAPYRLHMSVGYTVYVPGENPTAFIDRMDEAMYKNKKANKSRREALM